MPERGKNTTDHKGSVCRTNQMVGTYCMPNFNNDLTWVIFDPLIDECRVQLLMHLRVKAVTNFLIVIAQNCSLGTSK